MLRKRQLIMVPGPTNVPDEVLRAMSKPIISHRGPEFHELYDRIIENLRYVFQTENDVYPLTCSGTGGVECAISNLIGSGDKVIVPVHGDFGRRLKETVVTYGGVPIEVSAEFNRAVTPDQVEEALEKEDDVKAIALVYNETSTGAVLRGLDRIGETAEKYDVLLIVDAVSVLGGDYLPVDRWKIDVCVTGSQKCLACPPGLASISISEDAWKAIEKMKGGSHVYYLNLLRYKAFAKKLETPFTPAIPLFFALDEALKILVEEGLENRISRHRTCANAFYNAIEAMGLEIFPEKMYRSNTVISVRCPEGVKDGVVRELMRKQGVVIAGGFGELKGKIFRIGNMGIVSEMEVIATIESFEKALNEVGYNVKLGSGVRAARRVFDREVSAP